MKYSLSEKKLIFTAKEVSFIEDAKLSAKANSNNPETNYIANIVIYLLTGQKVIKLNDEKYTYPETVSEWGDYEYLSSHIMDGLFLISSEIYHYVSNIENHNYKAYDELVSDIITYNAYIRTCKDDFHLINIERCKKLIELAKYPSSNGKTIKNFLTFTLEESMDLHLRMNQYGFNLLDNKDRKLLTNIIICFIELGSCRDKIENFSQYAKAIKVLNIAGIEVKISINDDSFILEGEV